MAEAVKDDSRLSQAQQAEIDKLSQTWTEKNNELKAQGMSREEIDAELDYLHQAAERIRNSAGYTSNADGTYAGEIQQNNQNNRASAGSTVTATQRQGSSDELKRANAEYKDWYQSALENANQKYDNAAAQLSTAYDAALEQKIASLNSQLETSKTDYDQAAAKQDYYKRQAGDNTRLYNQIQGNTGGIGQAQYSSEQNQYDQAMLEIDLARTNTINEINTAIAEAKANNDYEKANALYELGLSQLQYLDNLAANYHSTNLNVASQIDANNTSDIATTRSDFYTKLNSGVYDEAAATALGLSDAEKAQFKQIANTQYNAVNGMDPTTLKNDFYTKLGYGVYDEAAATSLGLSDTEKAQFKKYAAAVLASKSSTTSGSGSSDTGTTPMINYADLYKAGFTTAGDVYSYLVSQKIPQAEAKNYANYFQDWLDAGGSEQAEQEVEDEFYDYVDTYVSNAHTNDWVMVPGFGRVMYQELLNMVESGKIIETQGADGKLTYSANSDTVAKLEEIKKGL